MADPFSLLGVFVSSHFTLDESERFPAHARTVLAALSSRTTRENMNRKNTASFETASSLSNLARSHIV